MSFSSFDYPRRLSGIFDAAENNDWEDCPDFQTCGARGDWEYEKMKEDFPIISTIPSGTGWEIQFVGEKPNNVDAEPVEPNLEHAYVHYMDNKLSHWNL